MRQNTRLHAPFFPQPWSGSETGEAEASYVESWVYSWTRAVCPWVGWTPSMRSAVVDEGLFVFRPAGCNLERMCIVVVSCKIWEGRAAA